MTCEETIETLNATKADLVEKFENKEIDEAEYKSEINAAETTAGVTPTTWPC